MNRSTLFFLLALALVAFGLRWWFIPTHLFFGPEQGRDFFEIKKITEGNFTLIGPKTDFSGVFHGPVYYYLAAVPFALSRGNPLLVAAFFTVIQAFTVFLAYAAGYEFSGYRAGIFAAVLYTVSYGSIVYSRWLTQVPLAIPLSFFFLWQLFRFKNEKNSGLVWAAVSAGFLVQVQFIFALYIPIFVLFSGLKKLPAYALFLYVVIGFGTFLLFDLRHDFLIARSIVSVFSSGQYSHFSFEPVTLFIQWIGSFL